MIIGDPGDENTKKHCFLCFAEFSEEIGLNYIKIDRNFELICGKCSKGLQKMHELAERNYYEKRHH